jgi:galactose mutarotase-like enzyme
LRRVDILSPLPLQEGTRLALADSLFQEGALVFDKLNSRAVRYGAPKGRALQVSFRGMPHLRIWTKPGAGYVCIEPWQSYANSEDFAGVLTEKPGIVFIAPEQDRSFEMRIEVLSGRQEMGSPDR